LLAFLVLLVAAPAAPAAGGTLDLPSEADAVFTPGGAEAKFGAVTAVGDVNRDGITDYAVGYPYASRLGRDNAGVVEVVFGRSDGGLAGNVRLGELGDRGFEIVGGRTNRRLGRIIAGAGDVNGDGFADVVIGSPLTFRTSADTTEGFVYVVFGKASTTQVDLAKLGSAGFQMWGAAGDRAGYAVGAVADLDGDGRSEIAVGAPSGRGTAGRVMIVLSSRRTGNVDLATVGAGALEIDGAAAGDRLGYALAGLPDVNGDGRPDLAIGAKYAAQGSGSVAIVHLPPPDSAAVNLASLAPGQGAVRVGPPGAAAGTALGSAGDLDGDGVADLLVGAPTASPYGRYHAGAVYLVSGAADGSGSLDTGAPWMAGDRTYDRLGSSLDAGAPPGAAAVPPAAAVAVGAPIVPPKSDPTKAAMPLGRVLAGAAYIVFPAAAGGPIDAALPPPGAVTRLAGQALARAGGTVAVARDGATTSVLVGAASPQDAAAWLVRDVKPPAFPAPQGEGCARDTNLEVIVDDSGSMTQNDKQALRQQALDLLVTKPGNAGRITGAVEFGTRARQIFAPVPAPGTSTGTPHDTLAGLMFEHIRHDAGLTNFTDAFLAARAENPSATARIFISDGFASREGVPAFDLSVTAGPPTYVIGLGPSRVPGADKRMTAIATSTGGEYFPRVTAQQLAPVVDTIDAVGLCGLRALPTTTSGSSGATTPTLGNGVKQALPESTRVSRRKRVARFTTKLVGNPSIIDLTLAWADKSAKVVVTPLTMIRGHKRAKVPVAKIRRALRGQTVRFRSLRLVGSRGASYATLRVAGLGGAATATVPAHAASKWDLANWGGKYKPGKKKKHGGNAARVARRAGATRVSLSAYRRR
jgi:hypothetical protein